MRETRWRERAGRPRADCGRLAVELIPRCSCLPVNESNRLGNRHERADHACQNGERQEWRYEFADGADAQAQNTAGREPEQQEVNRNPVEARERQPEFEHGAHGELRSQLLQDLLMLRKHSRLMFGVDPAAVHFDVEDSAPAGNQLGLNAFGVPNRIRQTGGFGQVVSLCTICDANLHRDNPPLPSTTNGRFRRQPYRRSHHYTPSAAEANCSSSIQRFRSSSRAKNPGFSRNLRETGIPAFTP